MKNHKTAGGILLALIVCLLCLVMGLPLPANVSHGPSESGFGQPSGPAVQSTATGNDTAMPEPNGSAYVEYNGNKPRFAPDEITTSGFTELSELDVLGRCGPVLACIGPETMPTEKRGNISSVKPTGWHTVQYPDLITDKYLWNRCHLVGWQLCSLNAEKRNLITGTRYLNMTGMLPFEEIVDDYVEQTGNHVMYRVIPDFRRSELVARGVLIEAYSVEDKGEGVSYCVYCFNIQPGIEIDYATGDSKRAGG